MKKKWSSPKIEIYNLDDIAKEIIAKASSGCGFGTCGCSWCVCYSWPS